MADDWKRKVEERQAEEERKRTQKLHEEIERHNRETQAKYERKLAGYRGKFRCHVCGKVSEMPGERTWNIIDRSGYDLEVVGTSSSTDWSRPGDLIKCAECGKWTCYDDLYQGKCKRCWKI